MPRLTGRLNLTTGSTAASGRFAAQRATSPRHGRVSKDVFTCSRGPGASRPAPPVVRALRALARHAALERRPRGAHTRPPGGPGSAPRPLSRKLLRHLPSRAEARVLATAAAGLTAARPAHQSLASGRRGDAGRVRLAGCEPRHAPVPARTGQRYGWLVEGGSRASIRGEVGTARRRYPRRRAGGD